MSCGKPHEMPCAEVLDKLYEFIDHEVGPDAKARIKHHIEECGPCLQEFGLEEQIKAIVKRSCSDPAPTELRIKVLERIAQARAGLRTEI